MFNTSIVSVLNDSLKSFSVYFSFLCSHNLILRSRSFSRFYELNDFVGCEEPYPSLTAFESFYPVFFKSHSSRFFLDSLINISLSCFNKHDYNSSKDSIASLCISSFVDNSCLFDCLAMKFSNSDIYLGILFAIYFVRELLCSSAEIELTPFFDKFPLAVSLRGVLNNPVLVDLEGDDDLPF